MSYYRIVCYWLAMIFFIFQSLAWGVWIYSPKTGKWTNPKYETKKSADLQWEHAKKFEDDKNYKRAYKEYKKLTKKFPNHKLAPYALDRCGVCYEKLGHYFKASEIYQQIIDQYPAYEHIEEVVKKQFKIGNMYVDGKRRTVWKIPTVSAVDKGVEIESKVVENMPYSEMAPYAKLNQGLGFEKLKKYPKAIENYKEFLDKYPDHELVYEVRFRMAEAAYLQSHDSEYDQEATDQALGYFQVFIQDFPNSKYITLANERIHELEERKAEGYLKTAKFYLKRKEKQAAIVYYKKVIDQYPNSKAAFIAKEKIENIENSKTGK